MGAKWYKMTGWLFELTDLIDWMGFWAQNCSSWGQSSTVGNSLEKSANAL